MPEYSYQMVVIACQHAVAIANDDTHGYNQLHRYGDPDYDCSSLVASCLQFAGFDIDPHGTATSNMARKLSALGFTNVINTIDKTTGNGLQYGDIILTVTNHHVAFSLGYANGNMICDAIHDENGTIGTSSTQPGDQTGDEILVRRFTSSTFYRNPRQWEYCFRWTDGGGGGYDPVTPDGTLCVIKLPTLRRGDRYAIVGGVQAILQNYYKISVGKSGIDSDFGKNTEQAVKTFQAKNGLKADGIIGIKTWTELLKVKKWN